MSEERKEPKKVSVKNLAKKIKLQANSIRDVSKQLSKEKVKLVCNCPHQQNGQFKLKPINKKDEDGNPIYICTECGKEINLKNITPEELNSAIDTLDRVADTIKMLLNLEDKGDQQLYKRYAKMQFRLLYEVSDQLTAAKNRGKSKKKKGGKSNTGDGWSRPQSR